jgi:hypothetical protein
MKKRSKGGNCERVERVRLMYDDGAPRHMTILLPYGSRTPMDTSLSCPRGVDCSPVAGPNFKPPCKSVYGLRGKTCIFYQSSGKLVERLGHKTLGLRGIERKTWGNKEYLATVHVATR